ncbi:RTA1 like protein-domain-containing protein [Thelonectria olida]|uniref:RTA1 like protein-domain-containing protein n=1 Tax=Thelonectria olida TaxID=1576542 RepID=A0A9P9AR25_9HYPO|nr:RTA1 like protein-domain-containing protein [Thelonectria olida]
MNTSITPANGIGGINFTPVLAANALFLTTYTILLLMHLLIAVRFWSTYGYSIGMTGGVLLELLGYVAKVQLSHNRSNKNAYIMYIIGLTLGPTFLSSSLYLGISTLQRHDPSAPFARISPNAFATLFILGDFLCLCLIGCGGSLAAIYAWNPIGVNLMIVGLALQVLFTMVFCLILGILYYRVRRGTFMHRARFFMLGSALAAACLFIRSCWRAAELSGGFNGRLASEEGLFFALDSIPIAIMCILLTGLHPKIWFGDNYCIRKACNSFI